MHFRAARYVRFAKSHWINRVEKLRVSLLSVFIIAIPEAPTEYHSKLAFLDLDSLVIAFRTRSSAKRMQEPILGRLEVRAPS